MCRSIKTLRPPYTDHASDEDMHAAALQYVRKVAGMRAPGKVNVEAFDQAVDAITEATHELLHRLQVRPTVRRAAPAESASTSTAP
jgi:hypothetical protein